MQLETKNFRDMDGYFRKTNWLEILFARWSSYLLGGRSGNPNLLFSPEVADLLSPPPFLLRSTPTPGRTAPEGSSVTPVTAPVDAVWPKVRPISPKPKANTPNQTQHRPDRGRDHKFEPIDTGNAHTDREVLVLERSHSCGANPMG
jgi:hypothetical protein